MCWFRRLCWVVWWRFDIDGPACEAYEHASLTSVLDIVHGSLSCMWQTHALAMCLGISKNDVAPGKDGSSRVLVYLATGLGRQPGPFSSPIACVKPLVCDKPIARQPPVNRCVDLNVLKNANSEQPCFKKAFSTQETNVVDIVVKICTLA